MSNASPSTAIVPATTDCTFGRAWLPFVTPGGAAVFCLTVVQVSRYGTDGPWATQCGWEQLAQMISGLASAENPEDPQPVPAEVTDCTTGCLTPPGAVVALARRVTEGGPWRCRCERPRRGRSDWAPC
jgi:hypothetical protein